VQEVSRVEPQDSATKKLIENQVLFYTRLDHMDENLHDVGLSMILGFAGLSAQITAMGGLPQMRRHEDSTHAIDQTAESVGQKGKEKAQQIADAPGVELNPEVVGQLIKSEVKEALILQREDDKRKKLETDAAAAEAKRAADVAKKEEADKERAREKRELKRLIYSGIVVGLVVLVATTAVSFMQGRHTGHDEGFAERAGTPPPTVLIMPTSASSMALTAPVVAPVATSMASSRPLPVPPMVPPRAPGR
jgi:hypothetical protein